MSKRIFIAISILLSYKINQSYERWWEARKIWGEIVNESRTLAFQLKTYINSQNPAIRIICFRQIAWNYSLGSHLRNTTDYDRIKPWLAEKEFIIIKESTNAPLMLMSLQYDTIRQLFDSDSIDKFSQIEVENTLSRLTSAQGRSERIKNTIFPPIYKFGLQLSIYLFVIFLSLSVAFKLQHFLLQFIILIIVSMVFFYLEKALSGRSREG